jgi:hypothetical protein
VTEHRPVSLATLKPFVLLAIVTLVVVAATDLQAATRSAVAADTKATADSPASPSPGPGTSPGPLAPGTAHVVISGSTNAELTLPFVPSESFPTPNGSYDLLWQDAELDTLNVTLDLEGGELTSGFVAVGAPGTSIYDTTYFADFFRSQCQIAITRLEDATVEGDFTCSRLPNADDSGMVDARGEFSTVTPPPSGEGGATPNHFVLRGAETQLTYDETTVTGLPQLLYEGPYGTQTFSGDEVTTQETALGRLVTVHLGAFPDRGELRLTLLIPSFHPDTDQGSATPFATLGIFTWSVSTLAGPPSEGALEEYETLTLEGTAEFVMS